MHRIIFIWNINLHDWNAWINMCKLLEFSFPLCSPCRPLCQSQYVHLFSSFFTWFKLRFKQCFSISDILAYENLIPLKCMLIFGFMKDLLINIVAFRCNRLLCQVNIFSDKSYIIVEWKRVVHDHAKLWLMCSNFNFSFFSTWQTLTSTFVTKFHLIATSDDPEILRQNS